MTYEIKDNPVHGKLLAENGKVVITSHDAATKLSERFTSSQLVKAYSGRYMVKLPHTVNSIEECDCQATGMMMPGQVMPQTYNERPDHEVQMARQELYRTAKLAIMTHELMKQVSERQGIEGWVASKITRAADYIETVFDYLDYEMRYPSEMMEAPMTLGQPAAPGAVAPSQQTQATPGQKPAAGADNPGMTQTPGMVKMAKVDTNGKVQGQPIMVPVSAVKSKQQAGFHVIGESASSGASGAGGMATSMGNGTGFASGGIGSTMRRRKKTTESGTDRSDGSPHDRGSADSYYGRRFDPHKYVDLPNGNRRKEELTDPAEIAAYKAGYENEGGQGKDYGESVRESSKTGPKFTGYWKGKNKGKPGNKMVGDA
jgi:hypothetical protein